MIRDRTIVTLVFFKLSCAPVVELESVIVI